MNTLLGLYKKGGRQWKLNGYAAVYPLASATNYVGYVRCGVPSEMQCIIHPRRLLIVTVCGLCFCVSINNYPLNF